MPRGFAAAVAAGVLAIAGIIALHADARYVYDGLTGDALPRPVNTASTHCALYPGDVERSRDSWDQLGIL
jgi:hypothetical protein